MGAWVLINDRWYKPYVVRLENVRAYNWIALDDGVADLVLRVSRSATGQDEEIFAASIIRDDVRVFEADVVFADEPHPSQPSIPELVDPRAPTWSDDALYTSGMFHGPLFQSIRSLIAWDDTGLDAELNDTFLDGFFEYGRYPGLILNPVLLDAIGHVTAFWIAQGKGTDFSSFPSSIDRIDLPGASFEETGGSVLRGRVSVQNEEDGSYLAGNYECVNPDGDVLFRASGWRDRFFDVPHRFYFARYKPLEGWYGEDCSDLFQRLREDCSVWFVPAFPDGFLENAGAIWKRVLAHTVLSAEERTQWAALSPNVSRRTDWLMGRVALKEVARNWIERTQGISLYPADLIVRVGNSGKPYIAQDGLDGIQWVPEVSLAHTKGNAIAAAAAPGSAVGIDFEFLNSIDSAESIRSAFTENDMKLIGDDQSRLDRILYAWCAKEASAKCLGEGLNGRPQAFELQEFGADNNNARVLGLGKELGVSFGRRGDAVMALACPSPSGPKL